MRRLAFTLLLFTGCSSSPAPGELPRMPQGNPNDMADVTLDMASNADLGAPPVRLDMGPMGDAGIGKMDAAPPPITPDGGGTWMPPGGPDLPVVHAPPTALTGVTTLLAGVDVTDVSVDQGGGVWAVSSSTVYYFPPGRTTPYTYNQANGLARGKYTWTDTWFSPGTYPVTFQSVAGGLSGQVVIGNFGYIADRLTVSPATGAVIKVEGLEVTAANVNDPNYLKEHQMRVVGTWKVIVDLNGTYQGTAYLGGFHGFYALHGMNADCGCLAFEEHQHYSNNVQLGGADVRGLAFTNDGDVWSGDRDFVQLLPQRSKGPSTGLFDYDFVVGIDVFAGRKDEVTALAVDAGGGLYVASDGNGLAYLAPATWAASYFTSTLTLPQNRLRGLAIDPKGDVWMGTVNAGLARFRPQGNLWTYYTSTGASGLPSSNVRALYMDKLSAGGRIWVATDNGIAGYLPQ